MIQNDYFLLKKNKTLVSGGIVYQIEVVNSYDSFNILSYNVADYTIGSFAIDSATKQLYYFDGTSFVAIASGGTSATVHNSLSGLNDGDYKHLTAINHDLLTTTTNDCSIHRHLSIVDSTGNNSISSNDTDIGFFIEVDGNTIGRLTNGIIYGDELSYDYTSGGNKFFYSVVGSAMRGGTITGTSWNFRGSNSFLWGLNGYASGTNSFGHGVNARAFNAGEYSHGITDTISLSRLATSMSASGSANMFREFNYDLEPDTNMTLLVDCKVVAKDTTNNFVKYYRIQAVLEKTGTSFVVVGSINTNIIVSTAPVNQNWGLVLSGTNTGINISAHGDIASGDMEWEIINETVVKLD